MEVKGWVGQQMSSTGRACVWDRAQAGRVEDLRERPGGNHVHDPRLRNSHGVGPSQASQRPHKLLAAERCEQRVNELTELVRADTPRGRQLHAGWGLLADDLNQCGFPHSDVDLEP
jgi:hypothetical protein